MNPFLSLLISAAASASPSNGVDAVEACRAIANSGDRLACFDRAAADLAAARERKDIVIMDRAEVRQKKRRLFGFTLPGLDLFGGGDDDDPQAIKEFTGTIQRVSSFGYGFLAFGLDDGSEWQTTEAVETGQPRRGDTIRIKRTGLGYRATVRTTLMRVRRVK